MHEELKLCINKPDHIAIFALTKFIDKLMETEEEYNTKSDEIPGLINDKNNVSALTNEMQITFPDKLSHDVYHNAIQDYYESLSTILSNLV